MTRREIIEIMEQNAIAEKEWHSINKELSKERIDDYMKGYQQGYMKLVRILIELKMVNPEYRKV